VSRGDACVGGTLEARKPGSARRVKTHVGGSEIETTCVAHAHGKAPGLDAQSYRGQGENLGALEQNTKGVRCLRASPFDFLWRLWMTSSPGVVTGKCHS